MIVTIADVWVRVTVAAHGELEAANTQRGRTRTSYKTYRACGGIATHTYAVGRLPAIHIRWANHHHVLRRVWRLLVRSLGGPAALVAGRSSSERTAHEQHCGQQQAKRTCSQARIEKAPSQAIHSSSSLRYVTKVRQVSALPANYTSVQAANTGSLAQARTNRMNYSY